ncbi:efflux RND transporter periplasmic adaptor subunit [Paenibacillus terrigena]|uniref:efflux RND transporter periplasmic adaptor subunit n=1 Tax=Paenibacillus terrigena TaxID=369333 RepID=UPI000368A2FD|nr:efflux RND transporter periplasmic adaptor subunit [Paenibacillus terrigena]
MNTGMAEAMDAGRKRKIVWISGLFIGVLLLLTLSSNTWLTMSLPKVRTEIGRQGPLTTQWNGTARLMPRQLMALSNAAEWTTKEVLVKPGDRVTKGQTLITYDNPNAEQEIQDASASLAQQRLSIEDLQDAYIEAAQNNDEMQMRRTKRELERARLMMGVQQRKVAVMQSDASRQKRIVASFDGVVMQVNAASQMPSGSNGPDVSLANMQQGYQFEIVIPNAVGRKYRTGDKLKVQVEHKDTNVPVEGTIREIRNTASTSEGSPSQEASGMHATPDASNQLFVVQVEHQDLEANDLVNVDLTQSEENEGALLVPNQAIHREGKNIYVLVVEERRGPLGNTFIVRKAPIRVGDTNGQETLVLQGVYIGDAIIVESNEPLAEGSRVRV